MGLNLSRPQWLAAIAVLWTVGVVVILAITSMARTGVVEVVHWSNGHLIRTGSGLRLLEQMAGEFNRADNMTDSGQRIEVKVVYHGSWEQARDLLSRVTRGVPVERDKPDPTIVTPSASHWLGTVNHAAGRTVVDVGAAQRIASAFIGIVTYRDMAECLGWPQREIGYADIIALRDNPRGWASYPCARAEWGQRPLVAYTDPTTSDTGRGVLLTLYALASGTTPERLTVGDVARPEVVAYVKRFQSLVDHYMIATRVLNTKVHQGPRFGHFFLMPEDNLIHLYEGTEPYFDATGEEGTAPPISRPMVMIYPREGSMARDNCACLVQAPWVTAEQTAAAQQWVAFLREDAQQRSFMAAGFRPGTALPLTDPASKITGRYGLDPARPEVVFRPELIDPSVAASIDQAWDEVKRPGIVTFVLDASSSMAGTKLDQARAGLIRALDGMARNNRVGFLSFSDTIHASVPVAPLADNRFAIAGALERMRPAGDSTLYEAVKTGIELTDAAAGEADAIRAVVVLTDGRANRCPTRLDDLVRMMSRSEVPIREFPACGDAAAAVDATGNAVDKEDVIGVRLAVPTRYPIQIFFVGIGRDADVQVGRILAEATGAEFQGVTEKDLARVLEGLSKYF